MEERKKIRGSSKNNERITLSAKRKKFESGITLIALAISRKCVRPN